MNWRLPAFLITALIIGAGIGYITTYIIYQPQVSQFESEKDDLQTQVNDLQAQIHDLYDEVIPFKMLSGSMTPTINLTDIVLIIPTSNASEINTGYETGDIIAFNRPGGEPGLVIIHRAVEKHQDGLTWYFKTKGDHNPGTDYWKIYEKDIIGKVTTIIPYSSND